jgi:hypothetical protein
MSSIRNSVEFAFVIQDYLKIPVITLGHVDKGPEGTTEFLLQFVLLFDILFLQRIVVFRRTT